MGQKTHPHGLRVGLYRKWNSTWYNEAKEGKEAFFHQSQIENFLKEFLYRFRYTKISTTKRALLVDAKLFKLGSRQIYIFIFFYKFRSKRRTPPRKLRKRKNDKKRESRS